GPAPSGSGPSPPDSRGVRPLFGPPQVTTKTVITVCAATLAFVAAIYAIWKTPIATGVTVISVLLATALDHAVVRLTRGRLKRGVAVAIVMMLVMATTALLVGALVPAAIRQGRALGEAIPALLDWLHRPAVYERLKGYVDIDQAIARLRSYGIEEAG